MSTKPDWSDLESLRALRRDWMTYSRDLREYVDCKVAPEVIVHDDGTIHISGEDGLYWCDYYGELNGGLPYIAPILEQWAAERGFYWEWDHPGSICLSW